MLNYGVLFTGRNETYRSSATNKNGYEGWEQNHGLIVSDQGSDTDYENQALKDKDAGKWFATQHNYNEELMVDQISNQTYIIWL